MSASRRMSTTTSRRCRYAATISPTQSCGPSSAASAATWLMVDTHEELDSSTFVAVSMSTAEPATYPIRHPVIEYDFENVNTLAMRGSSGARLAGLVHEPSRMIWS